jgi:hypothetical protein
LEVEKKTLLIKKQWRIQQSVLRRHQRFGGH